VDTPAPYSKASIQQHVPIAEGGVAGDVEAHSAPVPRPVFLLYMQCEKNPLDYSLRPKITVILAF
jgi:hypothetical protein